MKKVNYNSPVVSGVIFALLVSGVVYLGLVVKGVLPSPFQAHMSLTVSDKQVRDLALLQDKLPVTDEVSGMFAAQFTDGESVSYSLTGVKNNYIELSVLDNQFGVKMTFRDYWMDGKIDAASETMSDREEITKYSNGVNFPGSGFNEPAGNEQLRQKFQKRFDVYIREVYLKYGVISDATTAAATSLK